ncbi:MAG: DUF6165 family protein [Pseudomonadota bacterium]
MAVMIPVSWGELFDKITILQIKAERMRDPDKLQNVRRELAALDAVMQAAGPLDADARAAMDALRAANAKLWDIEDDIRNCEREQRFDAEFVRLARAVYYTNDERAALKKRLNSLLGSELVEEKSYASYT